jgi:hypothetical protein
MTTLGKILVFVNLVLSLLVGALIISTYVNRTDWHRAYNQLENEMKIATQNARTAESDKADTDKKVADLTAQMSRDADAHAKALDSVQAQLSQAKGQVVEEQARASQANANLEVVKQELTASQKEKDYLRDRVAQLDQTIQQQRLHVQESDNARVAAELDRQRVQGQNERLLAKLEEQTKELQASKQGGVSGTTGATTTSMTRRRTPAEDVEGIVKKTDAESGYVTLSIGSDAGLSKGDTLEVYRLQPQPSYLGLVEILAVRADQSVAKPVTRMNGVIQVGDRVSSRVAPKR